MPYRALYTLRQQVAEPCLDLSWFLSEVRQTTWANSIEMISTDGFEDTYIRGFIVRTPASDHGLTSDYKIVTSSSLTPLKQKIVCMKELMHVLRPDMDEQNSSAIVLDNSLRQFFGHSGVTPSLAVMSENMTFWMALGLVCPESYRVKIKAQYHANNSCIGTIAASIELEESQARALISEQYESEISLFFS